MIHAPASGERSALRGYRWQYDHVAARAYDALVNGDFRAVRLTDPQAGRVDDLILIRRGRADAYQFKSATYDSYFTFHQLVREQRTRSGSSAPSLMRSLADGWQRLGRRWENAHVHLVTPQLASINDHLGGTGDRPSPDHFSAFLNSVLLPLRRGEITVEDVGAEWRPALASFRKASGIAPGEFDQFLRALHLEFAAGPGLPPLPSVRHSDIATLSSALLRRVSEANDVVELDQREILDLVGWENRPRLHSRHEFPVNLDTYQPLSAAIEQLQESLARHDKGYVAVVGPPGAGKSTLLSQALTGSVDRIVRYYAYVPGTAPARTRMTAGAYLHDIVVMLSEVGIGTTRRELPANDVNQLRQQLTDQLDVASQQFRKSGRRTIVVADGLDHVTRDHSGDEGLLAELPRPEELPDGVLFVVGSRTLAPLNAYSQQQLYERQSIVDLQHHRLSPASVLAICRRAPLTIDLPQVIHQRLADLSSGHPLALSYLLNRLRDASGFSAAEALADAPAYAGDVAGEYRAVWQEIEDDANLVDIFVVCSRLRIAFTTEWLASWAPPHAVQTFKRKILYLFRRHHDGWRFFHDSFRQFVADRTALGDDAHPDRHVDSRAHRRVAELCAEADDRRIAWEQLHHRFHANQSAEVLTLAQHAEFRDQYRQFRSPDLIREDIALAMQVAAERSDVLTMLRLHLALIEADQRTSMLENIDMPGLLFDAGLVAEAIAWCGEEMHRVPLDHAFGLVTRLGSAGHPAGRQIFDLIEHEGLGDPEKPLIMNEVDSAALSWTRAAAFFRPLHTVITAIRNVVEFRSANDVRDEMVQTQRWRRYFRMLQELVGAVDSDEAALFEIVSTLADDVEQLNQPGAPSDGAEDANGTDHVRNQRLASLADVQVRAHAALIEAASSAETAERQIERLLSTVRNQPLYPATILDAAELLATHGIRSQASALLDRTPYHESLTVHALGHDGEDEAIERRFRYWRLRHLLASDHDDIPSPVPPDAATPAGNKISPWAPIHKDREAIELSARIDAATRTLAKLDAKTLAGHPVPLNDAWSTLVPLLDLFPPQGNHGGADLWTIERRKHELIGIAVAVTHNYGRGLPQRLSEMLQRRFRNEPERWPIWIRFILADELKSAGAGTPWYRETLVTYEANIASQSVDSRLDDTSELLRRYAHEGETETARRLVLELVAMAFGVGFRKDYQFDTWVAWLGRALSEPGSDAFVDEAAWLARVLTAVDPMTEGAPSSAAICLCGAVAQADPLAAVRIFEHFVRHGTASHDNALAELVRALVRRVDATEGLELAADLTGELLARAGKRGYSDLAEAILAAAEHIAGPTNARKLADSIADRTNSYALPTTRADWRRGLSLGTDADRQEKKDGSASRDGDYAALVLKDGRRIARGDVSSHIRTVDDIIAFRRDEADDSSFSWSPVVEQRTLSTDDVCALINAFDDGSDRSLEVLAALAAAAEKNGDRETAMRLSTDILRRAHGHSWSRYFGGTRLRAAAIAIRLGGQRTRVEFCRDLAHQLVGNQGLPNFLLSDLERIVEALDPGLSAAAVWPEIRSYLEGMTETVELPDAAVLSDLRCHWWLRAATGDRRAASDTSTPTAALAELAVGHLSHPAWLIRDAATTIVIRAIRSGNQDIAEALARFAQPGTSDDMLERAGRCLAAARAHDGFATPDCLQPLERILAHHPSQVIRDLAADPSRKEYRALSPMYHLALPPPIATPLESERRFLAPHEWQYKMVADGLGLNLDTLLTVAARYSSQAASTVPEHEAVMDSLRASRAEYRFPSSRIASSRAAFGRVLADMADARLLDDAPPHVRRLLRTVDVELLSRIPRPRPCVLPAPPKAGVEKSIDEWREGIEDRLEEQIRASTHPNRILIGARSRLTVLNWGLLEEEFNCGTAIGTVQPANRRVFALRDSLLLRDLVAAARRTSPDPGEPLVVANDGSTFLQLSANWLSFRPDLAATLEWTPDSIRPGRWRTASGDLAVETIWWVDGSWGHAGRAFDDTVAEGHAVVTTSQGLLDITDAFGTTTRHFELTRLGRDEGTAVEPVSATRSLPIVLPRE